MSEVRPAKALLIDFGGVLTSSVFESFRAYMDGVGVDPKLVERLLREDEESSKALVAHESGEQPLEHFEEIFAEPEGGLDSLRPLKESDLELP